MAPGKRTKQAPNTTVQGVPRHVFEGFLTKLTESGIPKDLVDRLRILILEKGDISYESLKDAVLPEE